MKKILLFFYVFTMIKSANLIVTKEPGSFYVTITEPTSTPTTWTWVKATSEIYVKLNEYSHWDQDPSPQKYICGKYNNSSKITPCPCPLWLTTTDQTFYDFYNYPPKNRPFPTPTIVDIDNSKWMLVKGNFSSYVLLNPDNADSEPLQNTSGEYTCSNEPPVISTCPWLEKATQMDDGFFS